VTSLLDSLASIHAEAPDFEDMNVKQEILETGIKVVDLLAPYAKGGKIGEGEGVGVGSGRGLLQPCSFLFVSQVCLVVLV